MYQEAGVDPKDRKGTRNLRDAKYKEHENQWRMAAKNRQENRPGKFLPFPSDASILTSISATPTNNKCHYICQ